VSDDGGSPHEVHPPGGASQLIAIAMTSKPVSAVRAKK